MKKGFLEQVPKGQELYGPEGSSEGVLPDGAGDPLGYLPKGLRQKMKVVDTSKMSQAQVQESAREYAETGTTKYAEFHPEAKKAMQQKGSASASASSGVKVEEAKAEEAKVVEEAEEAGPARPQSTQVLVRGEDLEDDALQVSIELPQLDSIAMVDLEVSAKALSLEAGDMYKLELPLKYTVDDDSVSAKFDKVSRTLLVTLPIRH